MDACQVHLDITTSFDLTSLYLNLVVSYVAVMILLSRVEDRKAVLGLFNTAHELQHGSSDASFPRLGQMVVDYDPPLRKLSEEFIPHSRLLIQAISSVAPVYLRRNLTAEQWRGAQMLSLVAAPQQMLYAAQTETIPCEYLSLDQMDRWVVIGLTLVHQAIGQPVLSDLWQQALQSGVTTCLFRDEVILTHQYIQSFFETIKGYNKRSTELKDFYTEALQSA
jgi:NCK-associated protein 1